MRISRTKVAKNPDDSLFRQIFQGKGLVVLALVAVGVALFSGGMIYGSYLFKTKQANSLIGMARGLAEVKLGVISNYIEGLQADPVVLVIDMKNNDYQKLAYLREETLASADLVTSKEVKDETVPGKLSVRGSDERLGAKFSLTGQNLNHIGDPQKWSLRVKLKNDKILFGMNSFTLLVPRTRARPPFSEWLNHHLEKHLGLISLRYEFVRVILNGKDLGVYAMEERFDKRMIEHNERREGLTLAMDSTENPELKFYKQKKVMANPNLANQAAHIEMLWAGYWNGEIPAAAIFNLDSMARYYAMTDVINGHHTHVLGNEVFYLNPITRLLEPIGREWDSPFKSKDVFRLFFEDMNVGITKNNEASENQKIFHGNLFKDIDFMRMYFQYLREYSNPAFMNEFLAQIKEPMTNAQRIIYSDSPYYKANADYLFGKTDYINDYLARDFSQDMSAYQLSDVVRNQVTLANPHNFKIVCKSLRLLEQDYDLDVILLPNEDNRLVLPVEIPIEAVNSAFVDCVVPGIDQPFAVSIIPWKQADAAAKNLYPIADHAVHPAVDIVADQLIINAGPIEITQNLVVTKEQSLTIKAGADIDLLNGAFILSYGPLTIEGTETNPVRVSSSDSSGRGVVVLNAKGQNVIRYAVFSNLKPAEFPGWSVSAAVLFHETNVVIDHVQFENNDSEDALNIVRSDFVISNSLFDGNKSDAFDSDFSRGTVKDTIFLNTGNDSIDTSGSKVMITGILISRSGDKGISVGEASVMTGNNLTIKESGIAISSKDNSSFEFEDINLNDNALGFALFQKKPEYGPTQGVVRNIAMTGDGVDYLVEANSSLTIDDNLMTGDIEDVEALMYGNVYGRKTVR